MMPEMLEIAARLGDPIRSVDCPCPVYRIFPPSLKVYEVMGCFQG